MSRTGHVSDELIVNLIKLGAEILLLQEPYATKQCADIAGSTRTNINGQQRRAISIDSNSCHQSGNISH